MIPYNLKEDSHKSHPLDGHYGVMIAGPYINYPITIVDNHEEVRKRQAHRKEIHLSAASERKGQTVQKTCVV